MRVDLSLFDSSGSSETTSTAAVSISSGSPASFSAMYSFDFEKVELGRYEGNEVGRIEWLTRKGALYLGRLNAVHCSSRKPATTAKKRDPSIVVAR